MLLDSHVLLDVLSGGSRVGAATEAALAMGDVFVSAATTWELTVKARTGRLTLHGDLHEGVREAGFQSLPILVEHSLRVDEVGELKTNDPFDRLLLTQAKVEGLDFYTWDRA
ncbi:MAG TPA: type II toxin-antitoxin system VapC family toxin, partial [Phycicoccus sp.]|nr:type II toxin-antitoxin system VapC family toxin [Phycicoccus sp.]